MCVNQCVQSTRLKNRAYTLRVKNNRKASNINGQENARKKEIDAFARQLHNPNKSLLYQLHTLAYQRSIISKRWDNWPLCVFIVESVLQLVWRFSWNCPGLFLGHYEFVPES